MADEENERPPPQRLAFPESEALYPWLKTLLDAYHMADCGVAEAIRREECQGKRLACAKGCSNCCRTHDTIPVYPLEMMGVSWYATERLHGPAREALRARLRNHRELDACPFLIDGVCSVHPVRPMACRHFNVFGEPCAAGEDAYYSRRRDVLTPLRKYMDAAFDIMLPFYGVENKARRRKAIKEGWLHQLAKVMRECRWESLAKRMAAFDVSQEKTEKERSP